MIDLADDCSSGDLTCPSCGSGFGSPAETPTYDQAQSRTTGDFHCPRVAGCDFGAPASAGEQAKKIILIEADRVGEQKYLIGPKGRNARLFRSFKSGTKWPANRSGWTVPDLAKSLDEDMVVAFDFPFSIPLDLLQDADFAAQVRQPIFHIRERWLDHLFNNVRLTFDNGNTNNHVNANAKLHDLQTFKPWRQKRFWKKRATDVAAHGQAPLKHLFQNLFAMTLVGTCLLRRLESSAYTTVLDTVSHPRGRCAIETYPKAIAHQIGFAKSYKQQPKDCLDRAVTYLEECGISLEFDPCVRRFCEKYRTGKNDPDGADAFLCLVSAIAFNEEQAELCCPTGVLDHTLHEEGCIIVPKRIVGR